MTNWILFTLVNIILDEKQKKTANISIYTVGSMRKIYCRLAVLMAEKDPQLSQRQLASEIGLDITTINRLFTNNFSRVDTATVEALCNYFDKEVGDLLEMRKPEDIPQRKARKRSE